MPTEREREKEREREREDYYFIQTFSQGRKEMIHTG